MRITTLLVLMAAVHGTAPAADTAPVPWDEFKALYKESIERQIEAKTPPPPPDRKCQMHIIDEANYRLTVGKQGVQGEVLLSGRVVSGGPEPIGLFGKDVIIYGAGKISGGSLITSTSDTHKILFLPDGTAPEFQIDLTFMAAPREDSHSKMAGFAIPMAVRNSLKLSFPPEFQLTEAPGLADAEGLWHFSLEEELAIRYQAKGDLAAAAPLEIDTFSVIQPQARRMIFTTHCVPAQAPGQPIVLRLPPDAQFLAATLKPSWIARRPDNTFEIHLPEGEQAPFSIQFAVDEAKEGGFTLQLPSIQGNNGKEGDFVAEEPDDGQIALTGKGLILRHPVAKLGKGLLPFAGKHGTVMHIAPGEAIKLDLKRFESVSTPAIVLDTQYFFASFEETGSILSVLVMDVPAEAGPRLTLKPVANSKIWSLMVNGQPRKVYSGQGESWIIPLVEGEVSHVELAMLSQGEKLGLQGRLETILPETGLAARNLCVGIALPERVQLLSLEGPVSPAPAGDWKPPADFIGKPHLFSRSFHKGEGLTLAVSYKEPVKP